MSSTNKTSLGLNMWEASDKPVRQDFVNDNVIINEKITKLNSDLSNTLMLRGYASGDANNYTQTGIYQIISSEGSTMLNIGFKGPCVFLVYATSNYVAQEQIYFEGSLKRFRNNAGEWSAWK